MQSRVAKARSSKPKKAVFSIVDLMNPSRLAEGIRPTREKDLYLARKRRDWAEGGLRKASPDTESYWRKQVRLANSRIARLQKLAPRRKAA